MTENKLNGTNIVTGIDWNDPVSLETLKNKLRQQRAFGMRKDTPVYEKYGYEGPMMEDMPEVLSLIQAVEHTLVRGLQHAQDLKDALQEKDEAAAVRAMHLLEDSTGCANRTAELLTSYTEQYTSMGLDMFQDSYDTE